MEVNSNSLHHYEGAEGNTWKKGPEMSEYPGMGFPSVIPFFQSRGFLQPGDSTNMLRGWVTALPCVAGDTPAC